VEFYSTVGTRGIQRTEFDSAWMWNLIPHPSVEFNSTQHVEFHSTKWNRILLVNLFYSMRHLHERLLSQNGLEPRGCPPLLYLRRCLHLQKHAPREVVCPVLLQSRAISVWVHGEGEVRRFVGQCHSLEHSNLFRGEDLVCRETLAAAALDEAVVVRVRVETDVGAVDWVRPRVRRVQDSAAAGISVDPEGIVDGWKRFISGGTLVHGDSRFFAIIHKYITNIFCCCVGIQSSKQGGNKSFIGPNIPLCEQHCWEENATQTVANPISTNKINTRFPVRVRRLRLETRC